MRIFYGVQRKDDWGYGQWCHEPDKVSWVDEATGLDCLIVRSQVMGALCGYVGLPPGHDLYGRYYDEIHAIECHGGLTFSDRCQPTMSPAVGVCHIPQDGRPVDVWWLGFDCGHAWDLCPPHEARMRAMGLPESPAIDALVAEAEAGYDVDELIARRALPAVTYKPLWFVRSWVLELASQLAVGVTEAAQRRGP